MNAYSIKVRGVVQGVGFRPFVYRLAHQNELAGWVLNGGEGVEIFLEGAQEHLEAFVHGLRASSPPAAAVAQIEIHCSEPVGLHDFTIRESFGQTPPTTRISPDLPTCEDCLRELFDPASGRFHYPYINCTNCGPRYSVTLRLPYDRQNTTMAAWPLDDFCARQYDDPWDRRFHAQPVACASCGPGYYLRPADNSITRGEAGIRACAALLAAGQIIAIKGLGGYHLACDANNESTIQELRSRKFRKEKPFALMTRDLGVAREVVELSADAEAMLTSVARPIVIAPQKTTFPGVAPGSTELGVMLPYTPLHYLLFALGAPEVLVMTSANHSSEPIAYEDADAWRRLSKIADAFLVGERPIARRVDDSVGRSGVFGPAIVRRSRGFAPSAVTEIPTQRPILAVGADLKNAITLVVDGQAFVSQHIGDLSDFQSLQSFEETIEDMIAMYEVDRRDLVVVHDGHPQYASSAYAQDQRSAVVGSVQHHRAHIASVLAERREWDKQVLGVALDGTGYGDDGTIWGGEFFVGSIRSGLRRVAQLRSAELPGGDAAARFPVQAAAGFLDQIDGLPDVTLAPFSFPARYTDARALLHSDIRIFRTSSTGRLFDAAAALLGFTREITFEGQAAIWLEQLARVSGAANAYPFPFENGVLDFRPLLLGLALDRANGRAPADAARAFQLGFARGVAAAIRSLCADYAVDTTVLSGGVFQNELLLEDIHSCLRSAPIALWTNHAVPSNDGGISLGQAALAAFGQLHSKGGGPRHA